MFVVVCYDIPDDRRRTRLFQLLEGYGAHVQYSVFECDLRQAQLDELERRIRKLVDQREDHVRFYFLCREDVKAIRHIGGGPPAVDRLVYVV